jgi:glycosyltransferase involved in cell wall biosynthesis
MAEKRLIIDVSTLVRTGGQATGISRVCRELSHWAVSHRDDVELVALDWYRQRLLSLNNAWAARVLQKTAMIDTFLAPDRWRNDVVRIREHLPLPLRYVLMCLQHPRRAILLHLERWRLRATSETARQRYERWQERFLTDKYRGEFFYDTGRRRHLLDYDTALLPFEVKQGDVLVLTGSDWSLTGPDLYDELKRKHGVRIVWLCYDIIALLYPQFFKKIVVDDFRDYTHRVLAMADLVLVSAHAIANDLHRYCREQSLPEPKTRVIPYGSDLTHSRAATGSPLSHGLEPERYALYVSTVEPRKGHRMLASVWKRLLVDGVPQANRFNLVFVGRAGWMVDELMKELKSLHGAENHFRLLTGVDDRELAALYRNAAFCAYPSVYEGYGLPIVEAYSYGKAVLASNGGALAEVVGGFSPAIDPLDEQAWYDILRRWIEHPAERAPFEKAIRERYRHPTWDEAARTFFSTIDEALGP